MARQAIGRDSAKMSAAGLSANPAVAQSPGAGGQPAGDCALPCLADRSRKDAAQVNGERLARLVAGLVAGRGSPAGGMAGQGIRCFGPTVSTACHAGGLFQARFSVKPLLTGPGFLESFAG